MQEYTTEVIFTGQIVSDSQNIAPDSHDIDGNNVVWAANDGNDSEIFLYDGNETIQLTDNDVDDFSPQISGNKIVWQRDTTGENLEIFLYDGNETIQLTDNNTINPYDAFDSSLQISGGNVVWAENDGNDSEIFLYNGNETIQLTDNDVDERSPQISGGDVVWKTSSGGGGQIVLYDGNETIELTGNSSIESLNAMFGSYVFWSQVAGSGAENKAFFYNGNEIIELDGNNNPRTRPGNKRVSINFVGRYSEIVLYDGNETTQLTDNDLSDRLPLISGDNIIWIQSSVTETSENNPESSIVLATPENTNPLSGSTVQRLLNNDTGIHVYTATVAERITLEDSGNYSLEGASYQGVDPLTGAGNTPSVPVYRFVNEDTGGQFYTTSEAEKEATQGLANFRFESEAFYAYENQVDDSIAIYRFFNPTTGEHIYTPTEAERDSLNNLPDYQSEGVAYYALPIDSEAI